MGALSIRHSKLSIRVLQSFRSDCLEVSDHVFNTLEEFKARQIVTALRTRINDGRCLPPPTKQQQKTQKESTTFEPIWVSEVEFPKPAEESVGDTLLGLIER